VLGYLDLERKQYLKREYPDSMELISLAGSLTRLEGEPFAHCHAALGDRDMRVVGGHLFQATASVTVEIFLRIYEGEVTRQFDANYGANLIAL
jgi:predicted DNA-binding protein with PD1-like motif